MLARQDLTGCQGWTPFPEELAARRVALPASHPKQGPSTHLRQDLACMADMMRASCVFMSHRRVLCYTEEEGLLLQDICLPAPHPAQSSQGKAHNIPPMPSTVLSTLLCNQLLKPGVSHCRQHHPVRFRHFASCHARHLPNDPPSWSASHSHSVAATRACSK